MCRWGDQIFTYMYILHTHWGTQLNVHNSCASRLWACIASFVFATVVLWLSNAYVPTLYIKLYTPCWISLHIIILYVASCVAIYIVHVVHDIMQFSYQNTDQCSTGAIRLSPFNSYHNTLWRLEICYNGHWGSVCKNDVDSETANVACRQLGYREG